MKRWTSLLGAMLLVLMLWTGSSGHAAERVDCMPVTSQTAGHFDGDRDESPSKSQKGAAHHHSGCGGHHFGSPSEIEEPTFPDADQTLDSVAIAAFASGAAPDNQLRPPIA